MARRSLPSPDPSVLPSSPEASLTGRRQERPYWALVRLLLGLLGLGLLRAGSLSTAPAQAFLLWGLLSTPFFLDRRLRTWIRTLDLLVAFALARIFLPSFQLFPAVLTLFPLLLPFLSFEQALLTMILGSGIWIGPFLAGVEPLVWPYLFWPLIAFAASLIAAEIWTERWHRFALLQTGRLVREKARLFTRLLRLAGQKDPAEEGAAILVETFGATWGGVLLWWRERPTAWTFFLADGREEGTRVQGALLPSSLQGILQEGTLPHGRLGEEERRRWAGILPPGRRDVREIWTTWSPLNGRGWVGLWIGFERPPEFAPADLEETLDAFGHALSLLIQEDLSRQEARRNFLNAVEGMVRALEAKHPYTRGHSDRVTFYALGIGTLLNLPPQELERLRQSTLLHDVGKLAIPDAILDKPGRLDEEEYRRIRQHPIHGVRILEAVDLEGAFLDVVAYHHERWDGQGYPYGLQGEEIPLLARIVAVADVFDALTSERPYRKPATFQEALAYLQREAGRAFDPAVVKAFRAFLRQSGLLRWPTLQDLPLSVRRRMERVAHQPVERLLTFPQRNARRASARKARRA